MEVSSSGSDDSGSSSSDEKSDDRVEMSVICTEGAKDFLDIIA